MADFCVDVWHCGAGGSITYAANGIEYLHEFQCGLKMTPELVNALDSHHTGIINSIHQRHHEVGHPDGAWTIIADRDGELLTGRCDCGDP